MKELFLVFMFVFAIPFIMSFVAISGISLILVGYFWLFYQIWSFLSHKTDKKTSRKLRDNKIQKQQLLYNVYLPSAIFGCWIAVPLVFMGDFSILAMAFVGVLFWFFYLLYETIYCVGSMFLGFKYFDKRYFIVSLIYVTITIVLGLLFIMNVSL